MSKETCHEQLPEQPDNPQGSPFRKAPWFILRKETSIGSGTALIFSVLWSAIEDLSTSERLLTYPITNLEISRRSGIAGGPQAALKHLQRLESLGLIKRHGAHRNRIFEILVRPRDNDYSSLIISTDILLSNLTPTQKLIASVKRAFPKAGKSWICWKLGITPGTYYNNIDKLKPYNELDTNPIMNWTEPYNELDPIGREGRIVGRVGLSKDKPIGPSDRMEGVVLPLKEVMMKHPYTTPCPPGWLERQERLLRLQAGTKNKGIRKSNHVRRKTPRPFSPPRDGYDPLYILDMDWIRANCPLVHVPAPGTKSYHEDIMVVRALAEGPERVLKSDEISAIVAGMSGRTLPGDRQALTEWYIRTHFLAHRKSQEERRRLFTLFSESLSLEYGGRGTKQRLSWAMRSHRNYCWLMHLWFRPKRRPRDEMPRDIADYQREFDRAVGIMPETMSPGRLPELARNIRKLLEVYLQDFRTRVPRGYDGTFYNSWGKFFSELVEYFDRQDTDIWPGWFRPDGQPVQNFLAESGFITPGKGPSTYNRGGEGVYAQG